MRTRMQSRFPRRFGLRISGVPVYCLLTALAVVKAYGVGSEDKGRLEGSGTIAPAEAVSSRVEEVPSARATGDGLIEALIAVESRGNPAAIGDNGLAVGVLQIHPIMVRDVNRILALRNDPRRFDLHDRRDRAGSIEMFLVWREHYCSGASEEVIARRWNGGPKGDRRPSTAAYWIKVQRKLFERDR